MRLASIAVVVAAVLGSALIPARGRAPAGDLDRLQGRWWTQAEGAKKGVMSTAVMDIDGNTVKYRVVILDNGRRLAGASMTTTIKINEDASPKAIDFISAPAGAGKAARKKSGGGGKGNGGGEPTGLDGLGLYKLEGDTLTICTGGPSSKVRPKEFKGSLLGVPTLVVYHRGDPPADAVGMRPNDPRRAAAEARAAARAKAAPPPMVDGEMGLKGAKVVGKGSANDRVVLRAADGKEYDIRLQLGPTTDADGKELPNYRRGEVFKPGNVVDVTLMFEDPRRRDTFYASRAHLVRGELAGPEKIPNGGEYRGALVAAVAPFRVTLKADGEEIFVASKNPNAEAFDADGKPLPRGQADRLLKEGNTVDVVLNVKPRRNTTLIYPTIREIRLVKGSLRDAAK
jgi:uncharacterized protein (TIGR03067 family)